MWSINVVCLLTKYGLSVTREYERQRKQERERYDLFVCSCYFNLSS